MGYKSNAELNSRVIRISLIGYNKLKAWGLARGLTMAELVDEAIELLEDKLRFRASPVFAIKMPMAISFKPSSSIGFKLFPGMVTKTNGVRYV